MPTRHTTSTRMILFSRYKASMIREACKLQGILMPFYDVIQCRSLGIPSQSIFILPLRFDRSTSIGRPAMQIVDTYPFCIIIP